MSETRQSTAQQLRAVDREKRTVDIIASDFSLDSYGTRIDPNGWDVAQYKKNPVICLQHDASGHSASVGLPIAKALPETVRIENGQLLMRIQFPSAGKVPLADQVFELVADGFLRGISVGFDPMEWEDVEEEEGGYKKSVRIYKKSKLVEVSVVTLPSNDNAVVVRAKSLNADLEAVQKKTRHLEELLDEENPLKKYSQEHLLMCVAYFERKQPANKESTKVLERFFKKILKEEQPAEEVKAWQRMDEALEATHETETVKVEVTEEVVETTTDAATEVVEVKPPEVVEVLEETTVKPIEEAKPEETAEEPITPSPAPVDQEPARKVQISLTALREFPRRLHEAMQEEVAAALRQGYPRGEIPALIDSVGEKLMKSIISHS